jgi:meso-butanediol dehydrogenase / (S,S)-butanediol dehydrogenase / diacetyl reductase
MGRLEGKFALVTGASTGIGRAVALRFAAEGARVLAVARGAGVESLRDDSQGRIEAFRADIADPVQVETMAQEVRRRFGRLDVVCNNAGVGGRNQVRIHELELDDWDRVLNTNLRGAFLVLKHTLPLLLEAGGGSIVNMASIGSFRATPGSAAYITSKGGLLLLTRTAALEYVNDNIRVNAVCPGVTATEILANLPAEVTDMLTARVPMGRMGTPEEVASLTLFLASDEASYITGAAYIIDGGRGAS